MKKVTKKIISILLMAILLVGAASTVLPPKSVNAALSDISVTANPTTKSGVAGEKLVFPITVVNGDASTSYDIHPELSSSKGWTGLTVYPDPFTLGPGSSANLNAEITIPSGAVVGDSDIITLTLYENGTTNYANSISLTVNVVAPGAQANRPLLVVESSSTDPKQVKAGQQFQLALVVVNRGQISAFNNKVTFSGDGFIPVNAGGMQTIQNIEPGGKITFYQNFMVAADMAWTDIGQITAKVDYQDAGGNTYTDPFTIGIPLSTPYTGPTVTPTSNASMRPQLSINSTSTDIDPLQPGSIFDLTLNIKNLGNADANNVIMVLGGGGGNVNELGTPQPGVNGSGADLTNFAPLGNSNIVVVGDIAQGASISVKQKMVVNVTTVPGAYILKTSFTYQNTKGDYYTDNQVVTLLVYSLPQVEINFYRDPGMLMAGTSNILPLQVTNLGRKSSVLGNMTVTCEQADVFNNTALVGALDPGGYFTLDSELMPFAEGPLEVKVTINYTDDFNEPRVIEQTLSLTVMPAPVFTPEPIPGVDIPLEPVAETFWSKVGRFFKGLLGLGSGVPEPAFPMGGEDMPVEDFAPAIVVPKG